MFSYPLALFLVLLLSCLYLSPLSWTLFLALLLSLSLPLPPSPGLSFLLSFYLVSISPPRSWTLFLLLSFYLVYLSPSLLDSLSLALLLSCLYLSPSLLESIGLPLVSSSNLLSIPVLSFLTFSVLSLFIFFLNRSLWQVLSICSLSFSLYISMSFCFFQSPSLSLLFLHELFISRLAFWLIAHCQSHYI